MAAKNLTSYILKTLIHYEPETGVFTRISHCVSETGRRSSRSVLGPMQRKPNGVGYICFSVNNWSYSAHRLAWLYMTGEWPDGVIDHINRDRAGNRWGSSGGWTNQERKFRKVGGGLSYTEGRTYYRNVKVYICEECLADERDARRAAAKASKRRWSIFWGIVLLVGAYVWIQQ